MLKKKEKEKKVIGCIRVLNRVVYVDVNKRLHRWLARLLFFEELKKEDVS